MKKYLSAIAIFLSVLVVFSSLAIGNVVAYNTGDANKDGSVDYKDVLWMRLYLIKGKYNGQTCIYHAAADVNENNIIDTQDIWQMRRVLARVETQFYPSDYTVTSQTKATITEEPKTENPNANTPPYGTGERDVPNWYYDQLAICKTINGNPWYTVAVNQAGYSPNGSKIIKLIEGKYNTPVRSLIDQVDCYIVDEATKEVVKIVQSGKRRGDFTEALQGLNTNYIWYSTVDISDFTEKGTYRLYTPAGYSYTFTISDNPYQRAVDDLIMGLYYQRCGDALTTEVMQNYEDYLVANYGDSYSQYCETYSTYARQACHLEAHNVNNNTTVNAGEEVVIVDTYKKQVTFTYKYTSKPDSNDIISKLTSNNSYNNYYKVSYNDKSSNVYIYSISDEYLTEDQVTSVKSTISKNFTNLSFVEPTKETSNPTYKGIFTPDTDENGNITTTYPATDFAYGLHDAGDFGRYTQPAAQVIADLLSAYEMSPEVFTLDVVQDNEGENIPDVLDHARWEAKFLLNMQSKTGNSKGGFYFKICTSEFASSTGSEPYNDKGFNESGYGDYGGFRVQQVNFAATASAAGTLAHCAYVFKDIDPEFAAECKAAAQAGYEYYYTHISDKTNESAARNSAATSGQSGAWSVGGGAYGGTSTESYDCEFYMNVALYRVTGDASIHSKITSRATIPTAFDSQSHGGYGTYIYINAYNNMQNGYSYNETTYNKCISAFVNKAIANNETSADESNFGNLNTAWGWGSNPRSANLLKHNGIISIIKTDNAEFTETNLTTVRNGITFMLGANMLGYCFITGHTNYGSNSNGTGKCSENIHHYPSVLYKKTTPCIPGLLAAGYSKETSYGSGWITDSGKFRYRDDSGDHVTNEICVYWNSSAIFAFTAVVADDIKNASK